MAIAFTVLCGGAGGFYLYRKAAIKRLYDQKKADALAAAAQGNNQLAIDLLQDYLQRRPDDPVALLAYVRVRPLVRLPNNQHVAYTIYVLRHLLKLPGGEKLIEQKRQLLDLYVQTRYWTEALLLADKLLPPGTPPTKDDVSILSARTHAYWARKEYSKALNCATQWSAAAPTDLQAQLILLNLVHQTHDFSGLTQYAEHGNLTEVELANGLAANCQRNLPAHGPASTDPALADARPNIIRANGLLLSGKNANAKLGRGLLTAAANQRMDRSTAAELIGELDAIGDSADSLPVLKRMAQENPDPLVDEALARRFWEIADWPSVVHATDQLKASDPNVGSELLALRADALARLNSKVDAAPIRKVLAARQNDPVALAWVFILDQGDTSQLDPKPLSKLCSAAAERSAYLRFFLAEAEARLDEPELAIADCQRAVQQNHTWVMPPTSLCELLINAGRLEEALQAGGEAVRRQPRAYGAVLATYRAWVLCIRNGLRNDGDELANELARLQVDSSVPADGQVLSLHVDVLGATGATDAARDVLQKGLKTDQKTLTQPSLLQLAAVSRRYHLQLEKDCLRLCQARFGISPDLAYARAADEWAKGNAAGGAQLFQSDRAGAKDGDGIGWKTAWAVYLELAQDPRSAKELIQLADGNPANLQVQLLALSARSTSQDREFMRRTIDRVETLMGENGVAWRLAKARWLLAVGSGDASQLNQARNLLDQVVKAAPDQPLAHVLLSFCNEQDHRIAEAIDEMRLATHLRPDEPGLTVRLATLLEINQDFEAARAELARVHTMSTSDQQQRRNAAILASIAGDPKLALTLAQDTLSQAGISDGSEDLVLANMYWRGGNAAKALEICGKLLAGKPDVATIRFASELYAVQGRLDDATKTLGRLDQLKLERGVKQLVLADFSARYIGADSALKNLELAISEAPNNPQVWRAMIDFRLSNGQTTEALATIEQASKAAPNDPGIKILREQRDLLLFADADSNLVPLVLAFVRSPADTENRHNLLILSTVVRYRKATLTSSALADQVRALVEQNPQSLPLWMYAIGCYLKADRVDDAKALAIRTSGQFPASPEPQQLYVVMLRNQLDGPVLPDPVKWQELLSAAQKWRERTLTDPLAADIQIAEADIRLDRAADALTQLDPYVRNAGSAPKAYQAVLPLYTRASQREGDTDAAAMMEPLLNQGPAGRRAWISFAVRNLPTPQAAVWLDRVEKLIPPQATDERVVLAEVWSNFASEHEYPPGFEKALVILEPLARQTDPHEPYLVICAVAEEQSGRIQDAEAHYRQALKLKNDDLIAMNNLAMLLAGHGGPLREALSLVQSALKLRPDVPSLYDTQAFVQGMLHHYDDAMASAKIAIGKQPQNLQYRVTLARLQLDNKHFADAAQTLRELDALHPDPAHTPASLKQQIDSIRADLAQHAQAN
jgi:tetratricopeptide (TPR) repeat protein